MIVNINHSSNPLNVIIDNYHLQVTKLQLLCNVGN